MARTPRAVAARVWWSSLPLRVIALTLVGSALVLLFGGFVLMRQATDGVLAGKRQAAVAEATTALDRMQTQLRATDLRTASLYERLSQLADEAGNRPDQYLVVIQGPVSRYVSPQITEASVPDELAKTLASSDGTFLTPTTVVWSDASRSPEPGLVVGSTLQVPGTSQSYPVFLVFPETHEVETVRVLQQAAISTGALLLSMLALVAWLVSRQVTTPIREASLAAGRLAAGQLDDRLPVRGTDDLASLATSMNNMAEQLQARIQELENLSQVQQQFVSDVSHELRTPLTTVRMAADMLFDSRDEMDPFAARSTELMHDELDRFESLLADLLEISRFDAGAAVLSLDETDVAELVRAELRAERGLAEKKGCELVLKGHEVAMAEVDGRRVTRVLRNLVTNAIEHGEGRPVEVTIAQDEQAVAVTVRDHGVGFNPKEAEHVFQRFWRADPSRQRTVGGTGLGLAISLEDAALHDGWLEAWGRPRRGAQFRLTLPRREGVELTGSPLELVPEGES